MPEWMHRRAEHLLSKNPSMPKSEAFAIATQQMHALGKSPKGYGTAEGRREAKVKYDTPSDDQKTASWKDELPGGKGDRRSPKDFLSASVRKGQVHEREHTNSPHLAKEIALDHLTEDPNYYAKLDAVEKKATWYGFLDELLNLTFEKDAAFKAAAIGAATMLPGATSAARGIGGGLKGLFNRVPQMAGKGVTMLQEAGNAARDESVRALGAVKLPGFTQPPGRLSMPPGATMPAKAMPKFAFAVSQYSGPLSYGPFKQESSQPGFRVPSLKAPVEKKAAAATTPAGLLSQSRAVGVTPKVSPPPGPSIAQVSKPVGFGKPAPGALKTGI
jgi:uncharacterized protein DUF5661